MATLMQISESFEASSLLCACVVRGKAWTLDYVVSYVPAGRGRKRQRGCFLIISETAHIIFFCRFNMYHVCFRRGCSVTRQEEIIGKQTVHLRRLFLIVSLGN